MRHTTRGPFGGGPRYGWGAVSGPGTTGSRTQFNNPRHNGWGAGPEAGLHRGEWQWRGHGPTAWNDYAWEYRGGLAREDVLARREAALGDRDSMRWRLAEERAGGRDRWNEDRRWDEMRHDHGRFHRAYTRGYGYGW